jgi:hypothetical protein
MNDVNPAPKRPIWPWALGGCLLLIVLVIAGIIGLAWFGLNAFKDQATAAIAEHPVVVEHFGTVSDVSLDFTAMSTPQADPNNQAIVVNITGSNGTGQATVIMRNNPSGEPTFVSATLTLPNGEKLELDPATMRLPGIPAPPQK